jgi:hypothetical protein
MDLKDLRKWVDDFGLIFKVRYAPNSGCEVRVFKQGVSYPFAMVVHQNCVNALAEMESILYGILEKDGGFDVAEEYI